MYTFLDVWSTVHRCQLGVQSHGAEEEDLMYEEQGTGVNYLTLALMARRTINGLNQLLAADSLPDNDSLKEAADSLKEVDSTTGSQHYEQVLTFQGAGLEERQWIIQVLDGLREDGAALSDKSAIQQAIDYFYKLEKQALLHFDQPPDESAPQSVIRLFQE